MLPASAVPVIVGVVSLVVEEVVKDEGALGAEVSMVSVMELLESEPSALVLPQELEKLPVATEIRPSSVLLTAGVKVAV